MWPAPARFSAAATHPKQRLVTAAEDLRYEDAVEGGVVPLGAVSNRKEPLCVVEVARENACAGGKCGEI